MNETMDKIIRKFNLFDIKSNPIEIPNFGRSDLTVLFKELGFKVGVEIGVEKGVYSEQICKNNPGVKLYCIDPWKYSTEYRSHVTQDILDGFCIHTKNLLSRYNCEIIREFSSDAVKRFEDNSLDFIYDDGNHKEQYVLEDLTLWSKKVRIGGIISGHDYARIRGQGAGVVHAVNKFTISNDINPWFILGLKDKIKGMIRDRSRSYMWVKQ